MAKLWRVHRVSGPKPSDNLGQHSFANRGAVHWATPSAGWCEPMSGGLPASGAHSKLRIRSDRGALVRTSRVTAIYQLLRIVLGEQIRHVRGAWQSDHQGKHTSDFDRFHSSLQSLTKRGAVHSGDRERLGRSWDSTMAVSHRNRRSAESVRCPDRRFGVATPVLRCCTAGAGGMVTGDFRCRRAYRLECRPGAASSWLPTREPFLPCLFVGLCADE